MQLGNTAAWERYVTLNTDFYGSGCMRYAQAWAELMEQHMADGVRLEACAQEDSHTADTEGISGYMYGCAVRILAECWQYGDALRRWHNLLTQMGTEGETANATGGVLNPAILMVVSKEENSDV